MLWVCEGCGARYAESLASCPQCGSGERHADHEAAPAGDDGGEGEGEGELPKITTWGGVSHPEDLAAVSGLAGIHPGAGVPVTAVEHPADGTFSPPAAGDGPVQAAVTVLPPEPGPEPEPAGPEAAAVPAPEPALAPKKAAPSLSKAKTDG